MLHRKSAIGATGRTGSLSALALVSWVLASWPNSVIPAEPAGKSKPLPPQPGVVLSEYIYEKAPFPACHASTIAETPQGLVAAWFGGTDEGKADVAIWVARHDRKKWSVPEEAADGRDADGKQLPCWNPVLFRAKDALLLFYKVGPSPDTWWGMLKRSADQGQIWSAAERLPEGILGPIKNKPVLLDDSTLLCGSSTEHDGWRVHFERTGDWGKTWEKTEPLGDGRDVAIIQPTIFEHDDGQLQIFCRSRGKKKIVESWSDDGGKTWSAPQLTALPNPNSGIDGLTLADGRALLIYNHTDRGRTPLNIAVSENGRTWQAAATLEAADGEFSYPAVIQSADGLVHITYTWNRVKIRHVIVDPKQLVLRDMPKGQWPK